MIGCDHGGFELKEVLKKYLADKGYEVEDAGAYTPDRVDYPDYAKKVGEAVAAGKAEQGILICGTGLGMSIAANKIHGIRAAVCGDCYSAEKAREHNNANILCLGAGYWAPAWRNRSWMLSGSFFPGQLPYPAGPEDHGPGEIR